MSDALMDAIVAAPEDDAPRLVWADREGGERGELVVIQCALARHDLGREERRPLAEREAELLKAHAYAWSGFHHVTFSRGFVDGLTIPVDDLLPRVESVFEAMPLLHALRLERLTEDVSTYIGPEPIESWREGERKLRNVLGRVPPNRIRTLDVSSRVYETGDWSDPGDTIFFDAQLLALLAEMPTLSAMRELVLINTGLRPEHLPAIARLKLERLQLGSHRLNGAGLVELLVQAPSIVRFAAWAGHPRTNGPELATLLSSPEMARLKELDLLSNSLGRPELEMIAKCRALSNLERLGVGWALGDGLDLVAESPVFANLRELDVYGWKDAVRTLRRGATFSSSLRVLRLPSGIPEAQLPEFTALERIEYGG